MPLVGCELKFCFNAGISVLEIGKVGGRYLHASTPPKKKKTGGGGLLKRGCVDCSPCSTNVYSPENVTRSLSGEDRDDPARFLHL